MITDNALRLEVKQLKVYKDINYKELSEELGIKPKSFYGWLKEYFNLSAANKRKLELIVSRYKE